MARTDLLLILRALRLHFSDEDGKKREKKRETTSLEAYHYTSLSGKRVIWRWGINREGD